ncbi:MAG: hypothetical protein J3K34DRAFT_492790 [Monoraphidium minutum]|nr:MAG: hypothetical protein J3K34DRAFT_492790 [Monoraphidium minutum]
MTGVNAPRRGACGRAAPAPARDGGGGGLSSLGRRIAEALLASGDPSAGHAAACPGGHDVLLLASRERGLQEAVSHLRAAAAAGRLGAAPPGGSSGSGEGDVGARSGGGGGGREGVQNLRLAGAAVDLGDLDRLEAAAAALVTSRAEGGWLPSPPSAYASVLLVHNAGQTGDLVPAWEQSAHNIRRQVDLNVTSPAVISAAVMRAFMGSPVCCEITICNISSVSWCRPYEAFGVYAAGKAARHMLLVATPALEADLMHRPNQQQDAHDSSSSSGGGGDACGGVGPRLRALSYAPGPIDTDMQAAAREALPPIPLKAAFEANHVAGRLVDPRDSAAALARLLARPRAEVANGSHWDYYDLCGGGGGGGGGALGADGSGGGSGGGARHPLDRPPAVVVAQPAAAAGPGPVTGPGASG